MLKLISQSNKVQYQTFQKASALWYKYSYFHVWFNFFKYSVMHT